MRTKNEAYHIPNPGSADPDCTTVADTYGGRERMNDYNWWKNYETWNVALWIANDESLYNIARSTEGRRWDKDSVMPTSPYRSFVGELEMLTHRNEDIRYKTPDDVSWNDPALDISALDEMIAEL